MLCLMSSSMSLADTHVSRPGDDLQDEEEDLSM